jgi:DeoR/GlpR family transcriptional regulator of sugar metabolism
MDTYIAGNKNQYSRRKAILAALDTEDSVKVNDLSRNMNVSVVTIRKDLDELEREGLLRRTHGAAQRLAPKSNAVDYEMRKLQKSREKKLVAKAAAALVENGNSVIINVGSTSEYVCEELKQKSNLIIITNALHIMNDLSQCDTITLFFLGGRFNKDLQITAGDDVGRQLVRYKADKLIVGADGVDIEGGVTSYNHLEDDIVKQMIAQAKEKILVVDDSKIGKVAFAHIADLSDFNTIVTNRTEKNTRILDEMAELGIRVIAV